MIKVAFVGERFREQVDVGARELAGVEVVLRGAPLGELERRAGSMRPTVLVLPLEELPEPVVPALERLLADSGAELAVVVYAYARRAVVQELLAHPRVKPVQGPLSLSNLRVQMLELLVRDILRDEPSRDLVSCPSCGTRVDARALAPRK